MRRTMNRVISILLVFILALSLAACKNQVTVTEIPTDAERIVELSLDAQNVVAKEATAPQAPVVEETQEHYTFSTTAVEGRLSVSVDADVRYPTSLKMPVARVSAVGFSQEQATACFHYFFAGEQPTVVVDYDAAKVTKQTLRDWIAQYEQEIADGTIMQQQQLTEEEAREEIKRLEAQIPDAPETAAPDVISDGTLLPGVFMNNDDPEELLVLNVETKDKRMNLYTPVDPLGHAQGHFFYNKKVDYLYEANETALPPNTSIEGMHTTWDEAMVLCKEFLSTCGVSNMAVGEAFQLEKDGKSAYRFHFVRTVAGVPLAVNYESTTYKGAKTPWDYEKLTITVDDAGIYDIAWGAPVEINQIVSTATNVISFAQAKQLFETMVAQTYEPETKRYDGFEWDVTVSVDNIVLSLLRVRDVSTDERTGLFVPAWVFYGETTVNGSPNKKWSPRIVYAINAVDGSVINMEMGY